MDGNMFDEGIEGQAYTYIKQALNNELKGKYGIETIHQSCLDQKKPHVDSFTHDFSIDVNVIQESVVVEAKTDSNIEEKNEENEKRRDVK